MNRSVFQSTISKARVHTDDTGASYYIPVLLTADGPLYSLVDYFASKWESRSPQWMLRVTHAVRLFQEYLSVNNIVLGEQRAFTNFRQRLITGTIDFGSAADPSGLWWSPQTQRFANRVIVNLSEFFTWWCAMHPGAKYPSQIEYHSRFDERISQASYEYRRQAAFLGHTWSSVQETGKHREYRGSRTSLSVKSEIVSPPAFPDERIEELLFKGFRVGKRLNYRDILITLLLNGAGFRESEPFHLYLWDVTEDPQAPGSALVLIHHPIWSDAPYDARWKDVSGKPRRGNRAQYLGEMYGLSPRAWQLGSGAAGWKGGMHETEFGGYYKRAYWFIPEYGRLFWQIWHEYIEHVGRIPLVHRPHPYAFMNIGREPLGGIYKLGKFEISHTLAIRRIGLVPAKHLGTSIHGHRHAYAQRLRRAGVSPEMIRRFMHHADVRSQQVYTQPDAIECQKALAAAMERLNSNRSSSFALGAAANNLLESPR